MLSTQPTQPAMLPAATGADVSLLAIVVLIGFLVVSSTAGLIAWRRKQSASQHCNPVHQQELEPLAGDTAASHQQGLKPQQIV